MEEVRATWLSCCLWVGCTLPIPVQHKGVVTDQGSAGTEGEENSKGGRGSEEDKDSDDSDGGGEENVDPQQREGLEVPGKAGDDISEITDQQLLHVVKSHIAGNADLREYHQKKMKEINEFAQEKAIYVVQFVTNEESLLYGGILQRQVCAANEIQGDWAKTIWDEGGKETFRRGLGSKRKSILATIQRTIVKSKLWGWKGNVW